MRTKSAAVHATHQYDAVPYQSCPFPQTEPGRLAAVAQVLGLKPAPVQRARVLELGCASGGNLIPMAVRYPEARLLGIDASGIQISQGRTRIESLGLGNIELKQADIRDIATAAKAGEMRAVSTTSSRTASTAGCRRMCARPCLQPASMASRRPVSPTSATTSIPAGTCAAWCATFMLFHAGDRRDPQTRVARARWMLDQLAKSTGADTAYGAVLRQDARLLAATGDDYIFHEFLEQENAPCHVRDFFALARRHGLEYLSEADISATYPETSLDRNRKAPAHHLEQCRRCSGAIHRLFHRPGVSPDPAGQGRGCGADQPPVPAWAPRKPVLQRRLWGGPSGDRRRAFPVPQPARRNAHHVLPINRDALSALAKAGAATRTAAELLTAALIDRRPTRSEQADLLDTLLKQLLIGMVGASTMPATLVRDIAERPVAPKLARLDAEAGRMWTTNALHQRVNLNVVQHALLPKLDGESDRASLKATLIDCARQGTLRFERGRRAHHWRCGDRGSRGGARPIGFGRAAAIGAACRVRGARGCKSCWIGGRSVTGSAPARLYRLWHSAI